MKRISLLLLLAGFFASSAAQADTQTHCGPLLQMVDEILEVSDQLGMPEDVEQRIRAHRDEARGHHDAGNDRACVESIDGALEILEQGG